MGGYLFAFPAALPPLIVGFSSWRFMFDTFLNIKTLYLYFLVTSLIALIQWAINEILQKIERPQAFLV